MKQFLFFLGLSFIFFSCRKYPEYKDTLSQDILAVYQSLILEDTSLSVRPAFDLNQISDSSFLEKKALFYQENYPLLKYWESQGDTVFFKNYRLTDQLQTLSYLFDSLQIHTKNPLIFVGDHSNYRPTLQNYEAAKKLLYHPSKTATLLTIELQEHLYQRLEKEKPQQFLEYQLLTKDFLGFLTSQINNNTVDSSFSYHAYLFPLLQIEAGINLSATDLFQRIDNQILSVKTILHELVNKNWENTFKGIKSDGDNDWKAAKMCPYIETPIQQSIIENYLEKQSNSTFHNFFIPKSESVFLPPSLVFNSPLTEIQKILVLKEMVERLVALKVCLNFHTHNLNKRTARLTLINEGLMTNEEAERKVKFIEVFPLEMSLPFLQYLRSNN